MLVQSNLQLAILPKRLHYDRRRPEETVLYKIIQNYWLTFVDKVEVIDEKGLPGYVKTEFEEFLKCGILANGFLRVRCERCGHEKILGFSCKRRGFCSSCNTRKMNETAALLTDYVIPRVPVRQWVITVPIYLRYLMTSHPKLQSKILAIIIHTISSYYKKKAKETTGIKDGQTGAVTLIQRIGS